MPQKKNEHFSTTVPTYGVTRCQIFLKEHTTCVLYLHHHVFRIFSFQPEGSQRVVQLVGGDIADALGLQKLRHLRQRPTSERGGVTGGHATSPKHNGWHTEVTRPLYRKNQSGMSYKKIASFRPQLLYSAYYSPPRLDYTSKQ